MVFVWTFYNFKFAFLNGTIYSIYIFLNAVVSFLGIEGTFFFPSSWIKCGPAGRPFAPGVCCQTRRQIGGYCSCCYSWFLMMSLLNIKTIMEARGRGERRKKKNCDVIYYSALGESPALLRLSLHYILSVRSSVVLPPPRFFISVVFRNCFSLSVFWSVFLGLLLANVPFYYFSLSLSVLPICHPNDRGWLRLRGVFILYVCV